MRLRREDPRLVGPYRLHRRLGSGGMGDVYLGADRKGQKVALKLIRAELAEDQEFRTRFAREVAAASRIRGGCIARLVASDIDAERPWLATVYVPGPSLYKRVGDDGPLPWPELAAVGAALADGLSQVHDAGVVHRDLKPSNILLSPKGPRIIDFGIAWSSGASTLTHVGTAVGSPGFLAPEQVRGVGVTGATDVFSLGSTLAYAATGDTPFGSGSSEVMLYRVVHEEPDLTEVPAALAPLIRACLAKDPADRPTPAQVHDKLRELAARGAAIGRSIATPAQHPARPQRDGHEAQQDTLPDTQRDSRARPHDPHRDPQRDQHRDPQREAQRQAQREAQREAQRDAQRMAGSPRDARRPGVREGRPQGARPGAQAPRAGAESGAGAASGASAGAGAAAATGSASGAASGKASGSASAAARPSGARRPASATAREPQPTPARRPAPPRGAQRTPPPNRPANRPANRPGGPAARRRLLRQRLIVFITVTVGVALAIATAQGCESRSPKGSAPASPVAAQATASAGSVAQDASQGLVAMSAGDPSTQTVTAIDWGGRSYQDPADGSRIDLRAGHGTGPGSPVTLTTVLPARYLGRPAAVVVLTRRVQAVPEDMIELYQVTSSGDPVLLAAHASTGNPNGNSSWQIQNGAVVRAESTPATGTRTVSTTRYTVAAKGTMTETWPGSTAASAPGVASPTTSASGSATTTAAATATGTALAADGSPSASATRG
nr:serine/threonine-protein kinase [Streptacidiphilus fuscans]